MVFEGVRGNVKSGEEMGKVKVDSKVVKGNKPLYTLSGLYGKDGTYFRKRSTYLTTILYYLLYWPIISLLGTCNLSSSSSLEEEKLAVYRLWFIFN